MKARGWIFGKTDRGRVFGEDVDAPPRRLGFSRRVFLTQESQLRVLDRFDVSSPLTTGVLGELLVTAKSATAVSGVRGATKRPSRTIYQRSLSISQCRASKAEERTSKPLPSDMKTTGMPG